MPPDTRHLAPHASRQSSQTTTCRVQRQDLFPRVLLCWGWQSPSYHGCLACTGSMCNDAQRRHARKHRVSMLRHIIPRQPAGPTASPSFATQPHCLQITEASFAWQQYLSSPCFQTITVCASPGQLEPTTLTQCCACRPTRSCCARWTTAGSPCWSWTFKTLPGPSWWPTAPGAPPSVIFPRKSCLSDIRADLQCLERHDR